MNYYSSEDRSKTTISDVFLSSPATDSCMQVNSCCLAVDNVDLIFCVVDLLHCMLDLSVKNLAFSHVLFSSHSQCALILFRFKSINDSKLCLIPMSWSEFFVALEARKSRVTNK